MARRYWRESALRKGLQEVDAHSDLADIFRAMPAATDSTNASLSFSGHEHFRHRLVLSIISGRPVRIDKIRSADANPGLRGPSI